MIEIPVNIPGQPTSVLVYRGALESFAAVLKTHGTATLPRRALVCFDRNCAVHANHAVRTLRAEGVTVSEFGLEATESAKSVRAVETIWDAALAARLDRGDCLVAIHRLGEVKFSLQLAASGGGRDDECPAALPQDRGDEIETVERGRHRGFLRWTGGLVRR